MRLDKYLKVSRLIKRRTIAKEVCDSGRITINDRVAKAGSEVKVGDKLVLGFGKKKIEVEILEIKETVRANEAHELYQVIRETFDE